MFSCCLDQILTQLSEYWVRNQDSLGQIMVFQAFYCKALLNSCNCKRVAAEDQTRCGHLLQCELQLPSYQL